MPEFEVRFSRELYADTTIVADDAEAAMRIAVSADYTLPPMSEWHVASGGEVYVRSQDSEEGNVLVGSWPVARIIPDDETGAKFVERVRFILSDKFPRGLRGKNRETTLLEYIQQALRDHDRKPADEASHYHDSQPDTPCRCTTPGTYAPQSTPDEE